MRRPPVTETLEYGSPDEGRPPAESGLLARFMDWYADRPRRVVSPLATALAVALVVIVAVDLAIVVQDRPAPVRSLSPSPSVSPSPPPTEEQLAERRRVAYHTAQFAESLLCDDRVNVAIEVLDAATDWSTVLIEARAAPGTPQAGRLVMEIKPFDIGVSYRVVSASGTCRAN